MLNDLAAAAASLARTDGFALTPDLGLLVHRRSLPAPSAIREVEPRFSAVLQGCKRVRIGAHVDDMRAGHYAVTTRTAAVGARVAHATPHTPYLAVIIRLDPYRIIEAIGADDAPPQRVTEPRILNETLATRLRNLLDSPTRPNERAFLVELAATEHGPALRSFAARALDPLVASALTWLETHIDRPASIAALARAIGASESSLHHRFKRATGTTPGQHHKRLRLERARDLLTLGVASSREIARRVGYASQAQFTRDYHRAFAITPGRDARAPR